MKWQHACATSVESLTWNCFVLLFDLMFALFRGMSGRQVVQSALHTLGKHQANTYMHIMHNTDFNATNEYKPLLIS